MNERIKEAAFQAGFINKLVSDGSYFLNNPKLEAKLKKFSDIIRADERDTFIAFIQDYPHWLGDNAKREIISAIRARGNT